MEPNSDRRIPKELPKFGHLICWRHKFVSKHLSFVSHSIFCFNSLKYSMNNIICEKNNMKLYLQLQIFYLFYFILFTFIYYFKYNIIYNILYIINCSNLCHDFTKLCWKFYSVVYFVKNMFIRWTKNCYTESKNLLHELDQ